MNNEAWDRVAERVIDKDFYSRPHRLIFQGHDPPLQCGQPHRPYHSAGGAQALPRQLERGRWLAYLVEIAKNTPSAANISAYAEIVRERAVVREMISVASRIVRAEPQGTYLNDLLDLAESKVFPRSPSSAPAPTRGPQPQAHPQSRPSTRLKSCSRPPNNRVTGVSSGYNDLDKMVTASLQYRIWSSSPLVPPWASATTLAMNLCEHAASPPTSRC